MIPKNPRYENKEYRMWLSPLPCLKCIEEFEVELAPIYENDPAHIRLGTDGALARKPSDDNCAPLCRHHHNEQHNRGEATFWGENLENAKRTAKALHRVFDKHDYGPALEVIGEYRERVR